jgi:hypothetical protein
MYKLVLKERNNKLASSSKAIVVLILKDQREKERERVSTLCI